MYAPSELIKRIGQFIVTGDRLTQAARDSATALMHLNGCIDNGMQDTPTAIALSQAVSSNYTYFCDMLEAMKGDAQNLKNALTDEGLDMQKFQLMLNTAESNPSADRLSSAWLDLKSDLDVLVDGIRRRCHTQFARKQKPLRKTWFKYYQELVGMIKHKRIGRYVSDRATAAILGCSFPTVKKVINPPKTNAKYQAFIQNNNHIISNWRWGTSVHPHRGGKQMHTAAIEDVDFLAYEVDAEHGNEPVQAKDMEALQESRPSRSFTPPPISDPDKVYAPARRKRHESI